MPPFDALGNLLHAVVVSASSEATSARLNVSKARKCFTIACLSFLPGSAAMFSIALNGCLRSYESFVTYSIGLQRGDDVPFRGVTHRHGQRSAQWGSPV